jgi:hypothetical protein
VVGIFFARSEVVCFDRAGVDIAADATPGEAKLRVPAVLRVNAAAITK